MNTLVNIVDLINTKSHKTFGVQTVITGLTLEQIVGIQNEFLKQGEAINKADDANDQGDYVIIHKTVVAGDCARSETITYSAETTSEAYAFVQALINVGRNINLLSA